MPKAMGMIMGSISAGQQLLPSNGGGDDSKSYKPDNSHSKDPSRNYLSLKTRDPSEPSQRYSASKLERGALYASPSRYAQNQNRSAGYEVQDFIDQYANSRKNVFYDSLTMQRYGLAA